MILMHYASPYYDPVKAHEYYMQHRVLVGRRSTSGLNEKGREAARYIKKNLDAERTGLSDSAKKRLSNRLLRASTERSNSLDEVRARTKLKIKKHTHKVQTEAAKLRIILESGSLKNDPEKRNEVISKIKELKEENDRQREELANQFQKKSYDIRSSYANKTTGLKNEHSKYLSDLRTEYDKKYETELDKLKSESQFQAVKKSKKSKKEKQNNNFNKTDWDAVQKAQLEAWREKRRKKQEKNMQHSGLISFSHMNSNAFDSGWAIIRKTNSNGPSVSKELVGREFIENFFA